MTRFMGALFVAALTVCLLKAFSLPLHDLDAAGHLLNAIALYEGRLPDPGSWSGFHPPLYYAFGAALWHALPEAIPLHVTLRLLSAAAGAGTALVCWRTLGRFFDRADAAVATVATLCVPTVIVSMSTLGNETLCALFSTAALARVLPPTSERIQSPRQAALAGGLAGAAALTKATGLIAVAVAGLACAVPVRRRPRAALRVLATYAVAAGVVCALHYARLLAFAESPLAVVTGAGSARAAHRMMEEQPPGKRHVSDYWTVPAATFSYPRIYAPGMNESVPGLLYAAAWSDAFGVVLPLESKRANHTRRLLAILGLIPSLFAVRGLAACVGRAELRRAFSPALALGGALVVSLLVYSWVVPHYSALKASYLLPAFLPGALLLAAALDGLPRAARTPARIGLSAVATLSLGVLWYTTA